MSVPADVDGQPPEWPPQPYEVVLSDPVYWLSRMPALEDALREAARDLPPAPVRVADANRLKRYAGIVDQAREPGASDAELESGDPEAPPDRRLTLTVEEAAQLLGISRALAYEAVQRGEIPHLRVGRRILVPRSLYAAV